MARSRMALGLAVLLTVNAIYTHAAAVVARRELLQEAHVGPASGPVDATFKALPPVPVEDPGFFEVLDLTLVPEAGSPPSAGPASESEVPLDLPPEAALETFTDPGNAAAYGAIQKASEELEDTAVAMEAITNLKSPQLLETKEAARSISISHLANMIRVIGKSPFDNTEFQEDIQNCAAEWEAVLRSAGSSPDQVGPWVELPANTDPTTLNQLQLWQYYYNALVVPGLTALTDYLADPSDTTYQQAFIAAAALTSGAGGGPGSQAWSVVLAPAQLLNYMAVATNPAGSCATNPLINRAADGATMCLYQTSAESDGLGALLEYDRHQYVYIAQDLLSSAVLTANVAAACQGIVNAVENGGDQITYELSIRTYQSWYEATVDNIYAFYEDMATYFWNNQFRKDVASAINVDISGNISSAEVTQNLLGFLNEKYDFLVWNGFVFTAPGLYTPEHGQMWAQVGGCMAGRVGIDTLWLPYNPNPTTCSTAGGSLYYPDYPLQNGTNIGYMLFWNAAGENTPLPGDNDKITGIAQGCQGSTGADPESIVNCVSAAYPNTRGIIALKPGNNVPDPTDYAAGSSAAYIFFSNLPTSGNDQTGTTLALLPPAPATSASPNR